MTDAATDEELTLAADFPAVAEAQWRALVAEGAQGRRLRAPAGARDRRRDPAAAALHRRGRAGPAGMPGSAPFTAARGGRGRRGRLGHPAARHRRPAAANAAILDDLEGGATSIQLRLDGPDAELWTASSPTCSSTWLPSGSTPAPIPGRGRGAAAAGRAPWRRRRLLRADLNADPLGAAVAGASLDRRAACASVGLAREVAAGWPGIVALLADGRPYHAGGASEAQELACAVATGIGYLRALVDAGLPAADAARQIGFAPRRRRRFLPVGGQAPGPAPAVGPGAGGRRRRGGHARPAAARRDRDAHVHPASILT